MAGPHANLNPGAKTPRARSKDHASVAEEGADAGERDCERPENTQPWAPERSDLCIREVEHSHPATSFGSINSGQPSNAFQSRNAFDLEPEQIRAGNLSGV